MAGIYELMQQMAKYRNEGIKVSSDALATAAKTAREATVQLKNLIDVEHNVATQSDDPKNIKTAIGHIRAFGEQSPYVKNYANAREVQAKEQLVKIEADRDIEARIRSLREKGHGIKDMKSEDRKNFEKGVSDFRTTLETGVYNPSVEEGAKTALTEIEAQITKFKLNEVMLTTDPTRNIVQDMTETATQGIADAFPSATKAIPHQTTAIKNIINQSDEAFVMEANRRIAATRMASGDDWKEGPRRSFSTKFRTLNDAISSSKGYIDDEAYSIMGIEGRFSEDNIMIPEFYQDRQYQLGKFMVDALPRQLREKVRDDFEDRGVAKELDTHRYNPEYIKAIYDIGHGSMEVTTKNPWTVAYEKRFTKMKNDRPGVETRSDWYGNLYSTFEDAYALYQDAASAIEMESTPPPEDGVESILKAGFNYNSALPFE